jgi:hypothetical protein
MSNYTAYSNKSTRTIRGGGTVIPLETLASNHQPGKKMNFIKKLFIRAVAWAHENRNMEDAKQPKAILDHDSRTPDSHPLRLHIWYGQGGIAIETASYDRRTEENRRQLYIIPESANLPEELDRILTIANLSRA